MRSQLATLFFLLPLLLVSACQSGQERGSDGDVSPIEDREPAPSHGVADEESSGSASALQKLLQEMGVTYLPAQGRLEVSGVVNMRKGLVEVFACAPHGKTHESVVVLDCVPSGLHAGLLALGLEPGTPVEMNTEASYRAPTGAGIVIEVRWLDEGGKEQSARAEDWVWDEAKQQSMPHVAWLFTGSLLQEVTGSPGEPTYSADYVKSLVTTYHDATTVVENPLPQGRDDTVYYVNETAVPPVGTPVTVRFRPADGR